MFQKMVLSALLVVAVVAFGSAGPQGGAKPKPQASEEEVFKGKVLAVTLKESGKGAVMQKARIKRLGGRTFLVGDSVKRTDDDDSPESTFWFAFEDVLIIREFKNIEDLKKAYEIEQKEGQ